MASIAMEEGSGTPTANLKTPVPEMLPRVVWLPKAANSMS